MTDTGTRHILLADGDADITAPVPARPAVDGRLAHDRNAFNLLRLLCASAVLYSHAHDLTLAKPWLDPTVNWLSFPVATLAVFIFFTVSGFLVTASFDRRRNAGDFIRARALRILPGLWVMLACMLPLAGAFFSPLPLPAFLADPGTTGFALTEALLANSYFLSFVTDRLALFTTNPAAGVFNGSLWSIAIEVQCYALLLVLAMAGFIFHRRRFALLLLLGLAVFLVFPAGVGPLTGIMRRCGFSFMLGVMAYVWRDRLPWSGWLAATLALVALFCPNGQTQGLVQTALTTTELKISLVQLAFGYGALTFALGAPAPVARFSARLPDISYGIYIYAFPIQQMMMASGIGRQPMSNFACSLVAVMPVALLSWYLIEKPALRLKSWPARRARLKG